MNQPTPPTSDAIAREWSCVLSLRVAVIDENGVPQLSLNGSGIPAGVSLFHEGYIQKMYQYIKKLDGIIEEVGGVTASCINTYEDLKNALQGQKDRAIAAEAKLAAYESAREIAAQPGEGEAIGTFVRFLRNVEPHGHSDAIVLDALIEHIKRGPDYTPHVADALDGERLDYMLSAGHSVKRMEDTGQWMLLHDSHPVSGGEFDTPREAIDDEMRAIAARAEAGDRS